MTIDTHKKSHHKNNVGLTKILLENESTKFQIIDLNYGEL